MYCNSVAFATISAAPGWCAPSATRLAASRENMLKWMKPGSEDAPEARAGRRRCWRVGRSRCRCRARAYVSRRRRLGGGGDLGGDTGETMRMSISARSWFMTGSAAGWPRAPLAPSKPVMEAQARLFLSDVVQPGEQGKTQNPAWIVCVSGDARRIDIGAGQYHVASHKGEMRPVSAPRPKRPAP